MDQDKEIIIADLYPDLPPEDQKLAEEQWLRYLALVRRIFNRLEASGELDELMLREEWKKRFKDTTDQDQV